MFLINPYILQASGNTLWNGLQAYYTADNTPNDALGTYNGTLTNGATYGTGIINNGFSFDGVNDYVDFGNNLDFDGSTPFSVSFWLKSNDIVTLSVRSVISKMNLSGVTEDGWQVYTYGDSIRFRIGETGTSRLLIYVNSALDTNYNHIAIVYDGSKTASNQKIYINGVDTAFTTFSDTFTGDSSNTETMKIGATNSGTYFNGLVDEVGIWDRELTASEVTDLYNSGAGKQYPTGILPLWNDLLAYYTADNTPNDALGTYNGTLTNGATYGTGIINQGFSLDGVNDYVNLGDVLDNDGTQPQSVSFWVNLNSTSTQAFVSKIDQGTPFNGWSVGTVNNKINYIFANNITTGVYVQVENSTVITTGTWYHVVATYDGSKSASGVKVYIDGSLGTQNILKDTLGTNSTSSAGIKATISSRDGGFLFTNGIIDEVGIWDRELTASEVTDLYNSGAGLQY